MQVKTNCLVTQSRRVVRYDLSWSSWPPWTDQRWGVPLSTGHWSGQTELSRVSHQCSALECAFTWQGKLDGPHLYTFPKYGPCFWDPPLCDPQNVGPQKRWPTYIRLQKWQVANLFPWVRHWSLIPEGCEFCMQTILAWANAIAQLFWFLTNILTSRSLESGSSFLSLSLVIALAMWPKLNCIFINQSTHLSYKTASSTQSRIYRCCYLTKNCICKKRMYESSLLISPRCKISQRSSLWHTSAFGQLLSNSSKISSMFVPVAVIIDW